MSRSGPYGLGTGELVGLDERPRPANMRERILKGLAQSTPFSSLQRRIILFNLLGLALLVAGVLYLNQFRSGLIEQRVEGLETLARLIAVTVAEEAAHPDGAPGYDRERANRILGRLVAPTGLRARLYDTDYRLTGDTRELLSALDRAPTTMSVRELDDGAITRLVAWLEDLYASSGGPRDAPRRAEPVSFTRELQAAAQGLTARNVHRNALDQLIVSVAHPVRDGSGVMGLLLLSTEGENINRIVRAERVAIVQVFILAAIVSTGLSVLLANTIARPIRRLAAAASKGGNANPARPIGPERVQIPDMSERSDEIGELSSALTRMTGALYARIDAIESFASDVAHEIKNPLTSLRSAVETMEYARTPEQRERLLEVINHDVGRMDRLVTDISNASRLDAELVRERMERFDLAALCAALGRVVAEQGEKQGVAVAVDLPADGLAACGLEGRIAQVITNFLDNALSFSPEGGTVRLSARRVEGGLRVSVADEGPGVPADSLDSVFERFYTERPEAQGFGNHSGLGLAISRQIVEAHGGRIWVENRPGPEGPGGPPAGAVFSFELPDTA